MKTNAPKWKILGIILLLLNVVACSTTNKNTSSEDPFEGLNRKIYAFNHVVDRAFIRPVAKTYDFFMPDPAQKGVTHFFSNLGEVPNVANDVLQADIQWALVDTWRFILNSTIGVAGLFDMASIMGLPKHKQDFGITLMKWGYKNSAYIVLPILGPYTIRDTIGLPVNVVLSPIYYVHPLKYSIAIETLNLINIRANLLGTDRLVDEAFDPYIFVRDAYLQNRIYKSNNNHHNNDLQNGNDDISQQDSNNDQDQTKETNKKTITKKDSKDSLAEENVSYSPF